jgi:hypothetical protein
MLNGMTWVYNGVYLNTSNPDLFVSEAEQNDNPWLTEERKESMCRVFPVPGDNRRMSRIRKALVKPKRLKVVFDNPESVMQVQIARLCVLYEDLRIELAGSAEDRLYPLDLNAAQYRKMYFLRRSVATLLEVASALHKLDSDPEFKDLKRTFDKERLRQWTQGDPLLREDPQDFEGRAEHVRRTLPGRGRAVRAPEAAS